MKLSACLQQAEADWKGVVPKRNYPFLLDPSIATKSCSSKERQRPCPGSTLSHFCLFFIKGKNRRVDSKRKDMLNISNTSLLVTLRFGQGKNFSIFAVTRIL